MRELFLLPSLNINNPTARVNDIYLSITQRPVQTVQSLALEKSDFRKVKKAQERSKDRYIKKGLFKLKK